MKLRKVLSNAAADPWLREGSTLVFCASAQEVADSIGKVSGNFEYQASRKPREKDPKPKSGKVLISEDSAFNSERGQKVHFYTDWDMIEVLLELKRVCIIE